ncbi:MAG: O-antigen ligase family protein, partial [Candidatus Levyibacteriota bacterium]
MIKTLYQNLWEKVGTGFLPFVQNNFSTIIFSLLLLLLSTQLGKHFWPPFSFVAGQRIDYLSPTLYLTDILIGILFIVAILKKQISLSPLLVPIFLFLVIGLFFSQNPLAGFYGLVKIVECIFLAMYVKDFFTKNGNFLLVVFLFSVSALLQSILAILQFFLGGSLGGVFYFFGERAFSSVTPGIANASINGILVLRPYGTFSHPNVLASYLLLSITLLFWTVLFLQIENKTRYFFYLVLLFGTVALCLTLSRVAIVLWIVFFFFLLSFRFAKNTMVIVRVASASIFSMILLSLIIPLFHYRFFGFSMTDESIVVREKLMQYAFQETVSHPFFGVGWNNFLPTLPSVSGFIPT